MAFELNDCTFAGPAIPEPFAKFELEKHLKKAGLLPKLAGQEGKDLKEFWDTYRRKLRRLGEQGGEIRVLNFVILPLAPVLGYMEPERQEKVKTREGMEDGGYLLVSEGGESKLRVWTLEIGVDLDAPTKRGHAYRFSPSRIAQRVLLAQNERVGLLSDGLELRILICDPARPDSFISMRLDNVGGWRSSRAIPNSFLLLLALCSPKGLLSIAKLTDAARFAQTEVTKKLREQAKAAVRLFVQELLDHPANQEAFKAHGDQTALAKQFWHEGLIVVYRLLFILKLESSPDPARAFSFASNSIWRNSFSPNTALAKHARAVLDEGMESGSLLESGLRVLFRLFSEGIASSELKICQMGGMLFGDGSTELIDSLAWGERAVAKLLDQLLWTPVGGKIERQRVHYGPLDVEDLGRVYEALLELEPGIATEPMCRLRRQKLEVVVPEVQGERYKPETTDGKKKKKAKESKVEWVEEIPPGEFYLRVGLGRKSTGSYYTPHAFVRFLVQETLGPQVEERSPDSDPNPAEILKLKVLDPAMGSGHFLVEACRYLGEKLYEACRKCDEEALLLEEQAEGAKNKPEQEKLKKRASELRKKVEDLPDPNNEMLNYLPSRAPEGKDSGLSQKQAEAIARRLIAVHCLYGVDKNPLAVELAKLSLWLESYAEGFPLTFMDHRLICGDSLTGPFFDQLLTRPSDGQPIEGLFAQKLKESLSAALNEALGNVEELEKTVAKDVADVEAKRLAKARLDDGLAPFLLLGKVWSGGVMLGDESDDVAYEALLNTVAEHKPIEGKLEGNQSLKEMAEVGAQAVTYDLCFPEVFHSAGGFNAVLGNPPWDAIKLNTKEFYAGYDFEIVSAPTKKERLVIEDKLGQDPVVAASFQSYAQEFERSKRANNRLYKFQKVTVEGDLAGRQLDAFRVFMERNSQLLGHDGITGVLVPSAFHANEGATGVRQLYLNEMELTCCYSFENRKKLFEIDSRFKFAAIVARKTGHPTREFKCAFYLHDLEWLFSDSNSQRYKLSFVNQTGGPYLSFLELRTPEDMQCATLCYAESKSFRQVCKGTGIRLQKQPTTLDMTKDSHRFTDTNSILDINSDPRDPDVAEQLRGQGYLPLHEGKTFHQYDDHWEDRPRYLVAIEKLAEKKAWLKAARYYRLAFRAIARSNDERTAIFCLLPPSFVFGNSSPCDRAPEKRRNSDALQIAGIANSYSFDWTLRQKAAANVSLFIIDGCPVKELNSNKTNFLVHGGLRLTCNHRGYLPLWKEQLGSNWREPRGSRPAWPVLAGDDARWAVRAAIDAVVADAYRLSRKQYEHVLSSFSHKSYPKAPELCLGVFDELRAIGSDAFCKKHDPYWDIPLVKKLPEPVIEFSISENETAGKSNQGSVGRGKGKQGALFPGKK